MYVIASPTREIGAVSIFDVLTMNRDHRWSKMVTVPISGVIPFRICRGDNVWQGDTYFRWKELVARR